MKRPAFQFYGGDWLRKPALRACSLAARGLWMDMIAIMSQVEEPYGHLVFTNSKDSDKGTSEDVSKDILRPILPGVLARMVGASEGSVVELLEELESFGVFSRTPDGVIYSRRMVRDEKVRQSRAAGGFQSENNPNVPRKKGEVEDGLRMDVRISSDPSFGGSPSSSSSSSKKTPRNRKDEHSPEERAVYLAYPKHVAPKAALKAIRTAAAGIAAADGTSIPDALLKLRGRVELYASQEKLKGTAEKYIPNPASWLNDGCYDNDSLVKAAVRTQQLSAAEEQSLDFRRRKDELAQAGAA